MLKVAIVGSGYIGNSHIDAYNKISKDRVQVVALIDANKKAGMNAADLAGAKYYENLSDAAADTHFDIVDICVPTFLHKAFTVEAANMGKHVLCEKPAALSVEDFDEMWNTCKKNNVKYMTGQVVRFFAEYEETSKRVKSGKLGNIHMLSEKRLCQHPAWSTWHTDPNKSGGGLVDLNTHDIDYIYSLFGMPESLSAVGWKNKTGCWNHIATLLKWKDKQAVCETSLEMTGAFPFTAELNITADNGTLSFRATAGDNIRDAVMKNSFAYYPVESDKEEINLPEIDPFKKEIEAFLSAVENDTNVPVLPEDTRNVIRIIEATKQSLETGKTIEF